MMVLMMVVAHLRIETVEHIGRYVVRHVLVMLLAQLTVAADAVRHEGRLVVVVTVVVAVVVMGSRRHHRNRCSGLG